MDLSKVCRNSQGDENIKTNKENKILTIKGSNYVDNKMAVTERAAETKINFMNWEKSS